MVKPDNPTDDSLTANSYKAQLGKPIDDDETPRSREDSRRRPYAGIDSELPLNQGLDMQAQNGLQKEGGTGDIPQEQGDLDKTLTEMLVGKFSDIRGSHRRDQLSKHLGVSLHEHVQGSETILGVNVREPPTRRHDLEASYNIQTTDSGFKQQLVDLMDRPHYTRDPPKLVNVKFQVVGFLGKGAEAECFLCEDVNTKQRVVHKKYYGKPRERERDTLKTLRHKSIPAFYGTTVEDGRNVLRMEFCGEPLRHWKRNRPVTEADIWEISEQLTDVLSHLDNHNIIHRDIKPDNVCIQTASRGLIIKLIDFGSVQTAQDKVAQDGRLTAAYMAPEMWLLCMFSDTPVSSKSDVFACALTICYLVYDVDVVPQALSTNDENKMLREMIFNPSQVADYVMNTFPRDKYSQTLMNLLLKMLAGYPERRISAADAHKEIVTHCMRPVFETLNTEEFKEELGIDIVNNTVPLNIFTPLTTPSYTETVPAIVTLQGETDWLSTRTAVDGNCQTLSDILINPATSDVVQQYQPELTGQWAAAPSYATGLTLLIPTDQQTNGTLTQGTAETTTWTIAMNDGGNQQSFINGAVRTKPNQQSPSTLTDDSSYCYLHGLGEQVSELVPVNHDTGITAVPESRPQILNQEQLLLIQHSRDRNTQNTSVSNRAGVPNLKLGNCQLDEDCHDNINPAYPTKVPEPPAQQETINKLKDRLKTGARKRSCPVLPNEYTNIPNLDLIHCKKKRRKND
ncbi:serine/threonine-protein kinase sck1-like [Mizuhopecten yessoensis]|uniref:Calcium-dependent protein kinase 4 n=1 Tax=Mizuhopecten yessoensis TaxID=6573 RepID=A0A210QG88_MIZYE|nr:serine/threonine-protein kinase sck1-like [Mizuhopecten yessoensis]OWF47709.1 Calcium-dependent protein kinase 4 [Mizuhopecten yessoensis]